jgi:putative transposase
MSKNRFKIFYQIVLVTHLNKPLITDKIKSILFDYLEIKSKSMDCDVFTLGGTTDHIHVLMTIPPKLSVEEVIENLKSSSINYINKNLKNTDFGWETGFFLMTVSPNDLERVESQIDSQIVFHLEKSCEEELKNFSRI